MAIKKQSAMKSNDIFRKYKLNENCKSLDSETDIFSLQQTLNEIIQIGSCIFQQVHQNQLNLNLNQCLIENVQKHIVTNSYNSDSNNMSPLQQIKLFLQLFADNFIHYQARYSECFSCNNSKIQNKRSKCYSERYSEVQRQSVFNMKQDDWISQDNYFDVHQSTFINQNKINQTRPKQPNPQKNKNNVQFNGIKISQNLLKPVKNFKKQTLAEVYQKKRRQEDQILQLIAKNKSGVTLSQFYEVNKEHLPVYQKIQNTQNHKKLLCQKRKIDINKKTMEHVTFKPKITKIAKDISKTFQQRLLDSNQQKSLNERKLIIEQLKNSPFNPKLNKNTSNNVQSRVKSIWSQSNSIMDQTNTQISNFSQVGSYKKPKTFSRKTEEKAKNANYFKISQKDACLFSEFALQ